MPLLWLCWPRWPSGVASCSFRPPPPCCQLWLPAGGAPPAAQHGCQLRREQGRRERIIPSPTHPTLPSSASSAPAAGRWPERLPLTWCQWPTRRRARSPTPAAATTEPSPSPWARAAPPSPVSLRLHLLAGWLAGWLYTRLSRNARTGTWVAHTAGGSAVYNGASASQPAELWSSHCMHVLAAHAPVAAWQSVGGSARLRLPSPAPAVASLHPRLQPCTCGCHLTLRTLVAAHPILFASHLQTTSPWTLVRACWSCRAPAPPLTPTALPR